jgi:hypothetical protein
MTFALWHSRCTAAEAQDDTFTQAAGTARRIYFDLVATQSARVGWLGLPRTVAGPEAVQPAREVFTGHRVPTEVYFTAPCRL